MNQQRKTDFSTKSPLLIVGASTRAAAYSALRAGFQPVCVDQYADQDLLEIAEVIPKSDVSSDWLDTLSRLPSREWIYTGAMENHPELIAQISQTHRLRGCDPKILERTRNPFFLEQILSKNRIQAASCLPSDSITGGTERWLSKPIQSAAGSGIHFVDTDSPTASMKEKRYLQRYQPGIPLSALFISFRQATVLIGISLQFSGNPAFHVDPFQFCGGVTLSPIAPWLKDSILETGQTISQQCQIEGIFGCDFILNPEEAIRIWLIEVNPRYTALTELFELQYRLPLLKWHLAACRSFENAQTDDHASEELKTLLLQSEKQRSPQISKGILYSTAALKSPEISWNRFGSKDHYQIPVLADIPSPGMAINAGSPICTVYGVGEQLSSCLQSLNEKMIQYERLFAPDSFQPKQSSDAFNRFVPVKKIEKLFF